MADVELVIKIPEDYYNRLKRIKKDSIFGLSRAEQTILHGIPLPKGQGRLIERVLNAAKDLKQKSKTGRWIPVSKRLPEESYYCLCCDKDGYMTIGSINKYSKEWCFEDDEVDIDVVAWTPLPEPYKAESEAAE